MTRDFREAAVDFEARDGNTITVEPDAAAPEAEVRLFALCSPTGALLLERGLLPLHASAIATTRGVVVFMGHSGQGKSTLAAHFQQRGFQVVSDDIAVVSFTADGRAQVAPGPATVKLWPDSLDALGIPVAGLAPLQAQAEKRRVGFATSTAAPLPLARIFSLHVRPTHAAMKVQPIIGGSCVRALAHQAYRANFIPRLGAQAAHFLALNRLAGAVTMRRALRLEDGRFRLQEFADLLAADFAR